MAIAVASTFLTKLEVREDHQTSILKAINKIRDVGTGYKRRRTESLAADISPSAFANLSEWIKYQTEPTIVLPFVTSFQEACFAC